MDDGNVPVGERSMSSEGEAQEPGLVLFFAHSHFGIDGLVCNIWKRN